MKNNINFHNLPVDIQIDVIRTLYFYSDCHIEHAHGKMSVQTSYCLKSHYADDEWISQEITKKDLGIKFDGNNAWFQAWSALEQKHHKRWCDIEKEEKEKCISYFDKMIAERAEEELVRIISEA